MLEAGPDYGAFAAGGWPRDLLDARALGVHARLEATRPKRHIPEESCRSSGRASSAGARPTMAARRSGGAGSTMTPGPRAGSSGWSTDDLLPFFQRANERMRVRNYDASEVTPFHQACLEAAVQAGIPQSSNLNDLDEDEGIAPSPVNIWRRPPVEFGVGLPRSGAFAAQSRRSKAAPWSTGC